MYKVVAKMQMITKIVRKVSDYNGSISAEGNILIPVRLIGQMCTPFALTF